MFRTPKDDLEILERSGAPPGPNAVQDGPPKATASAQIHVRINDPQKRSVSRGELEETLKKLLVMLIKPAVEESRGGEKLSPFLPLPPSPPSYANLLGGLSAISKLVSSEPSSKIVQKVTPGGPDKMPLRLTLNDKPMRLVEEEGDEDEEEGEEDASVAEKADLKAFAQLFPVGPVLTVPKAEAKKKKKPKGKPKEESDDLERLVRKLAGQQVGAIPSAVLDPRMRLPLPGLCSNPLLSNPFPKPLLSRSLVVPWGPNAEYLATEFIIRVPVIINNKQYSSLNRYQLINSLLESCKGKSLV